MTMKIERLYAITVYLLNHGRTSASELAKHFEVSLRTIQRDIDSLCLSGIPVVSVNGAAGGYEISESFKMDKEFATPGEYSLILTALRGLVSATGSRQAEHALEKLICVSDAAPAKEASGIILDFSVLREGDQDVLQRLQAAVAQKRTVSFIYTNNSGEPRVHRVEPVAVLYRWYAWYLLAYSRVKEDYRTYKLVRMSSLEVTDESFTREHKPADAILQETDRTDTRQYTEIFFRCSKAVRARAAEYLKGVVAEEYGNGDVLMKATVVDSEQLWFGTLLSLGDGVEVTAPEHIRQRLKEAAERIISLYKKE